jgi:catechol 2,3-dioxygenase
MIAPATSMGVVSLTVADLARSLAFYESHVGLAVHRRAHDTATLGAGGRDLLDLVARPSAIRVSGTTGLYHYALLVPTRVDLARSLRRFLETQTTMQGFADHGVSEALYLADPDGHGIEVYRDRPAAEWPEVDGALHMGIDPLDVAGLLEALDGDPDAGPWTGIAPDTRMGHVHLHVSHIEEAERFYAGILGFEVRQRYGPSALFVAAGGYHHHLGLNTWAGVGAPPPPSDAIALRSFDIVLPDEPSREAVLARIRAAGLPLEAHDAAWEVRDPSGNIVRLTDPRRHEQ